MKPGPPNHHEIDAFLRGEPAALGEVRAAVRIVVRGFRFPGRDVEQELMQEVMGRLVDNLIAGRFRGDASLRTYAQKIAKYACLGHIRRQRAEVRLDFETIPSEARWAEPEATLLQDEEHARNLAAFAALPEESRLLLRMIFVEGVSYLEAARRLGVSENTVKSRVFRARLQCRESAAVVGRAGRRPPESAER